MVWRDCGALGFGSVRHLIDMTKKNMEQSILLGLHLYLDLRGENDEEYDESFFQVSVFFQIGHKDLAQGALWDRECLLCLFGARINCNARYTRCTDRARLFACS